MTIKLRAEDAIDLLAPPGATLAAELDARNITQRELALRMGRSHTVVNDIIHGRKSIKPQTALDLEDAIEGIPAQFWLNLQSHYDLDIARSQRRHVATVG